MAPSKGKMAAVGSGWLAEMRSSLSSKAVASTSSSKFLAESKDKQNLENWPKFAKIINK